MIGELRARREALESLWRQGLSGRALLKEHARLVDDYLCQCFAKCSEAGEGMALIALGGYGREELFPYSDIDLLLLHEPDLEDKLSWVAEAIFYPLWDAGLEVGHGVRTASSCLAHAQKDLFFRVAMLDARFLAGSQSLFKRLAKDFQEKFIFGQRHQFFADMVAQRAERLKRFGIHSYLLEPNIKESRGGLRDLQTVLWLAKVIFGVKDLAGLEESGVLLPQERLDCDTAWEYLVRVRNQLHYASTRKNDQLYFEQQEEMALAFEYTPDHGLLAVEHFMRDLHGHLRTISSTTELFIEYAEEALDNGPRLSSISCTGEPGLSVRQGKMYLVDQGELTRRPTLIMRIFSQAAKKGLPIHHRSQKILSGHILLIDDRLRLSRRMAKAFLDTLLYADESNGLLSTLLDSGVLYAYIPEFKRVESLIIHDLYHVFAVDRHLLQTVNELQRLKEEEKRIFVTLTSPKILYLAALLHDIGKGQGGSHAERGAVIAGVIGRRLGLIAEERALLEFLVQNHLFLMHNALRRDMEDESFIIRCSRNIGDLTRLSMLYLLTIADARATGPMAWNEWKAALVQELYLKIAHLLGCADIIGPDRAQAVEWVRNQVTKILKTKTYLEISRLPEEYLLSFAPEEIAGHIEILPRLQKHHVLLFPQDRGNVWSLQIIAKDCTGLLSFFCGTLALHNLNIVAAKIHTWQDGTVVDVFDVQPTVNIPYNAMKWNTLRIDLELAIMGQLSLAQNLFSKYQESGPGLHHIGLRPRPKVVIDNQGSDFYTILEVFAEDRLGLLYDITRTLARFGVNIYQAKIGTCADQVVDVFYVHDRNGHKIVDQGLQARLYNGLLNAARKPD